MVTFTFKSFFFCFFLMLATGLSAQKKTVEAVLAAEQTRFEAMMRRDTVSLLRLLSDDLIYIHSNAMKESKEEHIRAISSGKVVYQEMKREQTGVRLYGKTAITSGTIRVKGMLSANPFELKMLYTAVYRKKKQGWQLLNWQSTKSL